MPETDTRRSASLGAWHTALVLLPLLIGSAVSFHQHTLEHVNLPGMSVRLAAYFTVIAEEWIVVLLIWLGLRRRGLSIAFLISGRWQNLAAFLKDLGLGICFAIAVEALMAMIARFLESGSSYVNFLPLTPLEAIVWVFLAFTAGFCEELIFRGYLTHQLTVWTNSKALAIFVQGIVFGLIHGNQLSGVLWIMLYAWLIGMLASWRKSLRPGMLARRARRRGPRLTPVLHQVKTRWRGAPQRSAA